MRALPFAAVLLIVALAPVATPFTRADELDAKIETLLRRSHVPGVAIAKLSRGKVEWVRAFGMADDHRKVEANTVFEVGSLSKPLVALATLKLVSAGSLDLDRPLTWVMDEPWPEDPDVQTITARMVLDHTSGLPNRSDGALSVMFRPGSRWSYSGEGFRLLARAIGDLTGQAFDSVVERSVLRPVSMTSSSWVARETDAAALARGHDRQGKPVAEGERSVADPASSFATTAGDYGNFIAGCLRARIIDISPAAIELMRATQVPVDESLGLFWGLGWALQRTDDRNVFFHWGSNPGFKSFALGDPAREDGIVILTNGDNGLEIAEEITKAVLGRSYPLFSFRMMHPKD